MTVQRSSVATDARRVSKQRTSTGRINLGPGGAIDDQIIIHVELTSAGKRFVSDFGLALDVLTRQFRGAVYLPVQITLNKKIDEIVPQDTKDLSIAMKESMIVPARVTLEDFKMVLNTEGIDYAGYVQKMPRRWLRHPAPYHVNTSKRSGKKRGSKGAPHVKIDPGARTGSFNIVLQIGRRLAERLYTKFRTITLVPALRRRVNLINKRLKNAGLRPIKITNFHNLTNKLFKVRFK